MSDVIFIEVMKQTDQRTLSATARLIDRLSGGLALASEDLRANTEIARFLYAGQLKANLHRLEELVWTCTASVMGVHHLRFRGLPPDEERVFRKAWIDFSWDLGFEQMLQMANGGVTPIGDMDATAEKLNRDNLAHVAEMRTYPQTVLNELAGVLDLMRGLMVDVISTIYEREHGKSATPTEQADAELLCFNIIVNAFRTKPQEVGAALRTLYIKSKCFAAVRWDQRRKLEGNDLFDFRHAAAAIGYCDAFFTEKGLRSLLTANHVGLDKEFDCFIESREAPILAYLRALL